jgi:small subunit ribosomal protein S8
MLTDPIADMLTRIRNANKAMHDTAQMPTSRIKEEIARVLKDEGYIKDFRVVEVEGQPFSTLVVELKFGKNRQRVISGLKRVSRPGFRASSAGSAPPSCPPPPGSSRAARPRSAASAAK